jgi:hypothetical protein
MQVVVVKAIDTFHKSRLGYLVFGLAELGLAYVFASLAIDSGSLWQWLLAIILFIGFLQNIGRLAISKWRRAMH